MEENKIILDKDLYSTEKDFQLALASFLQILTDNHYNVLVNRDGGLPNLFSVKFLHDPQSESDDWGCDRFMRVTSEEEDKLLTERSIEEDLDDEDYK